VYEWVGNHVYSTYRLNQWKDQVAKESNLKELTEKKVNQLKIRMKQFQCIINNCSKKYRD
jgi:hypothetical protein